MDDPNPLQVLLVDRKETKQGASVFEITQMGISRCSVVVLETLAEMPSRIA